MQQALPHSRQLLKINAAADRLGLQPRTIYSKVAAREIETVRLGRSVRIPVEEVERLISENTVPRRKRA